MKKSITDVALEETLHYLKSLNTQKHFHHIIQRHVDLHNKGIFVNFRTNAKNAMSLFHIMATRYNVLPETLTAIVPEFSRTPLLEVSAFKKKIEREEREHKNELRKFNGYEASCHQELDLYKPKEALSDFIVKWLTTQRQIIKKKEKKTYEKRQVVNKLSKNVRNIESTLEESELMYFSILSSYYVENVQTQLESLFGTRLRIIYPSVQWKQEFLKQESPLYEMDESLSSFEERLLYALSKVKNDFQFNVISSNHTYLLNARTGYVSHKETPSKESKVYPSEPSLRAFIKENKELMTLLAIGQRSFDFFADDHPYKQDFFILAKETYPKELTLYRQLLTDYKAEQNEHKRNREPAKTDKDISTDYPDLSFSWITKRDEMLYFAIQEEVYNEGLGKIEGNDLVMEFGIFEKERENESFT